MPDLPFQSALVVTPGSPGFFEPPKPGRQRVIRTVNVVAASLGSNGQLIVRTGKDGVIFAAGRGQNQELGTGNYQLPQPIPWFSSEPVSAEIVAGTGTAIPDSYLGSNNAGATTVSVVISSNVAVGERIIGIVYDANAAITAGHLSDTRGNIWHVATSTLGTPTAAIVYCDVTNALLAGDTVTYNSGGATSKGLSLQSVTGSEGNPYGASTTTGTSAAPFAPTNQPVANGDIVVATAFVGSLTGDTMANPVGWSPLNNGLSYMIGGYLNQTATIPSAITYSPNLSASTAWTACTVAFPASASASPSVNVILTGTDYGE